MNIVVCLKQVPGTTEVKINPETNTLIREGVKAAINPFDTYALEEGVRLKEKLGGKVTVITMGPPQAEEALREAVSLGADEGVLISDRAFAGSDTLATSYVLATAVSKMQGVGLVICGKQTLDGDTGQVGPEMAERLGLPFVAYVSKVEEMDERRARLRRIVDEGYEVMDVPLPAVITVSKEINTPRLPSLRGQMKAKSARFPVWTAQTLGAGAEKLGLSGSPTRVVKVFFPERSRCSEMLEGGAESQADQLLDKLRAAKVI